MPHTEIIGDGGLHLGDLFNAIIMGIIEGLTEFLPVSSTGHLILTADLLNFQDDRAKVFEVVIQLGAVLAVLVLYRKNLSACLTLTSRNHPA